MVKAVRGAVSVDTDTEEAVTEAVQKVLTELMEKNSLGEDDLVSIIFSQTMDLVSANPATSLRKTLGFSDVPLFCTQEPQYSGSEKGMIRVLVTCNLEKSVRLQPVYLGRAQNLRKDLPHKTESIH